ncbi:MAG TPA: WD40 repeat domain-containing serine/threonine-protein kinase [Pirellulaceae bacterium]|nr:WD40 repeat domain-containing serine/threonine-protein kinase [Pirellulaceae bacterium]HMO91988.1 WD40 repeat domain-containing serine/threonine-protein kinase [Pirellulaceae bacterium]HMP68787.1 WD40 repeat domain-containing serine/threonine-protein kinase [Pirellulaceae bacterium]
MSSVGHIVEAFLDSVRSGHPPNIDEFCRQFPEVAEELRDLLPTVLLFENATQPALPSSLVSHRALPKQIGHYEILREIGFGGMGIVYEARHRELDRRVALKVLTSNSITNASHRERFQREIRLASNLHHTNIVPVFETGMHEGDPFFTMQFIDGQSFEHWYTNGNIEIGPNHFRKAAEMIRVVAGALHHAHSQGVLHRDIKPSNLLIGNNGVVWITDFGLARQAEDGVTRTGDIVGTLRYIAPERFSSVADARSDVYSLGLTLYELCTLRPAFSETDPARMYRAILETNPPKPSSIVHKFPRDLDTIILRAIEKDPQRRYPTAAALAEDLRLWLDDQPIRSRPVSLMEQGWRWTRRNPVVATLVLTVACMLFALVCVLSFAAHRRGQIIAQLNQANIIGQQRLYDSYLGRAQASRWSGRPGQNFLAMESIAQAARLVNILYADPASREDQRWNLRNEAIAAMVLADVSPLNRWQDATDERIVVTFDDKFERYAKADSLGNIYLHAVADDAEIGRIAGDGSTCWELRLSPEASHVIGMFHPNPQSSTGAFLRVWDCAERRETLRTEPFSRPIIYDWHCPSGRLAVADLHHNLLVFDFVSGELINKVPGTDRLVAICFLDENNLALARDGRREIEVFSLDTMETTRTFSVEEDIASLAWSPKSQRLAAGTTLNGYIYLWNLAQPFASAVRLRGHSGRANRLYFTHDGKVLASNSWDSTVRLWDVLSAREIMRVNALTIAHPGFGRRDRALAFTGPANQFSLWNVTYDGPLRCLPRTAPEVFEWAIVYHPKDDHLLAVATAEGIRFWDCRLGETIGTIDIGLVRSIDFSADGKFVFAGGDRGVTKCELAWPAEDERSPLSATSIETLYNEPVYRSHLSRNGGRIVFFAERSRSAQVIDLSTGQVVTKTGEHRNLDRAVISPDGRWIVTSTWGGSGLKVWDADTGDLVSDLHSRIGSATIAFSPTGTWLAVTDGQRQCLWRVDGWDLVHEWTREEPDGWPGPLTFSPDENLLVLPRNRTTAQLVDVRSGKCLSILEAPQRFSLTTYSFSPGGRYIAMNHGEGIHLWDLHHIRQRLATLDLDW